MKKNINYVTPIVVIFVILGFVLSLECNKTILQDESIQDNQSNETIEKTVEIRKISSFLKNTTYIYKKSQYYENNPILTDYNYTPPQKYELNYITVKIRGNTATTYSDCYITHKIMSSEFYEFTSSYATKLAILHTNKGEIRIAETIEDYQTKYRIFIKYGNFSAGSPFGSRCTDLPNKHKIVN